jgi:hypothetical protein
MQRFESKLERYDQIYGESYTIDLVPGIHGTFHLEPNVHHFVRMLRARLDERDRDEPASMAAHKF